MSVIRAAECRRSETPTAVMTTLASPTQGGAGCALWRVDAPAGSRGPVHAIDAEQVWAFLEGSATIDLGGELIVVEPGDALVMPAGTSRQVSGDADTGFVAVVTSPAGAQAVLPNGGKVVPPWTA